MSDSWLLSMESIPLPFLSSLISPRALSWDHLFFFRLCQWPLPSYFPTQFACFVWKWHVQIIPLSQFYRLSSLSTWHQFLWFSSNHFNANAAKPNSWSLWEQKEPILPWCFYASQQSTNWADWLTEFLGIWVTSNLSNLQVDYICKKARRTCDNWVYFPLFPGFIYRAFTITPTITRRIVIYLPLVHSILEYGKPIFE